MLAFPIPLSLWLFHLPPDSYWWTPPRHLIEGLILRHAQSIQIISVQVVNITWRFDFINYFLQSIQIFISFNIWISSAVSRIVLPVLTLFVISRSECFGRVWSTPRIYSTWPTSPRKMIRNWNRPWSKCFWCAWTSSSRKSIREEGLEQLKEDKDRNATWIILGVMIIKKWKGKFGPWPLDKEKTFCGCAHEEFAP